MGNTPSVGDLSNLGSLVGQDCVLPSGATVSTQSLANNAWIGIYFSAHWCPPCRNFTPLLATFYTQAKRLGKSFEIIFCSNDHSESDFKAYHKTMPWPAIHFGDRTRARQLGGMFQVSGIPCLVIISHDGKIVNSNAVPSIRSSPDMFLTKIPSSMGTKTASPKSLGSGTTLGSVFETPLPKTEEQGRLSLEAEMDKISGSDLTPVQKAEGFKIVGTLTNNIIQNPTQTKFRIVKKDNSNIKDKLSVHPSFVNLLLVAGFRETQNTYMFPMETSIPNSNLMPVRDFAQAAEDSLREVIKEESAKKEEAKGQTTGTKAGYVCDGDVCRKLP